jgi:DNA-binding NarL/FixJ family response regulator
MLLMAGGHTTREIADLLELCPHTVENHLRHIYEKLGVGTRNGAVAEATRRGLLTAPDDQQWSGAPETPMLVLLRGRAGECRDSVVRTLAAEGIPFVSAWRRKALPDDLVDRHEGVVLTVLVDPESTDWSWVATARTAVVVVRGADQHERFAVVDALVHRANGLLSHDDVTAGLVPTLRVAVNGLFAMSLRYARTLATWALPTQPESPDLTQREREILSSIALGHTVRQTARTLGIATKTVENIQARMFRKLGARNRAESLSIALEVGLLQSIS